jgi:hypothetical protein
MERSTKRIRMWLAAGSVALLASCSDPGQTDITTKAAPLQAWNIALFDRVSNSYTINVCFIQSSFYSATPTWAADKQMVQDALTNTWQASSAIHFAFNGDCPSAASIPATWMPIDLQYDSTYPTRYGGDGAGGKGARLGTYCGDGSSLCCFNGNCQVHFGYGSLHQDFQTTAVHEVGHGLGFRHERSRIDYTGCWNIENTPATWEKENPMDLDTSGPLLTANVDLESVMAQWQCYETREHGTNYYWLTAGDQTAVNFIYPISVARGSGSMGSPVGFHTSSGTVIRSDGSVTTDWTVQGGSSQLFSTTPSWYTWVSGTPTFIGSGTSMSASTIAAHSHTSVSFSFTDVWGRSESGQENVVVSSSSHTAILGVIAGILSS